MINKLLFVLGVVFLGSMAFGQQTTSTNFSINEVQSSSLGVSKKSMFNAKSFKLFEMDIATLKTQLTNVAHKSAPLKGQQPVVSLPHPDGTIHAYKSIENTTMSVEFANKFPEINTYDAVDIEGLGYSVKWDITPKGLHAMIMRPGQSTIFIDPYLEGNTNLYIVYNRSDYVGDKIVECGFTSDATQLKSKNAFGTVKSFGTCELRTYRLALAATGEYTAFHGGTVALAAAAQVTTMNRVNGVYERDMAITMEIIPNNDLIIYTSTGTDPYSNGNPGTMINQNQTNIDNVIGSANYDIGHVFGTNSGGLAGLGVVCTNSQKARGVTGSSAPIGDPFDIDYVAHEMGHQFGANHTFNNSCGGNRNDATAVEPGSGNTIMAYAGICAPNTSNFSDDHFSGKSLEEISFEIQSAGHQCEVITPLANIAPTITGTNGNVAIPANTPFALTVTATDPDGNVLTYNWEQMDNQISTQPPSPTSTGGPNFRSNPSLTSPTRYFPNLTDLANGGPFTWEVLPSVTRTMNFRVTVKDNASGGACNDHTDITLSTDGNSGPFVVTYPNATGIIWDALTTQTVTWDVANTDLAPVNCSNVDLLLSVDGGITFPYTLATGTPNDGTQAISVPNVATTTARVMVIAANGTFFDISDNNFTINALTNDYTLDVSPTSQTVCQPNDVTYAVTIGSLDSYSDPVNLSISGVPAGASASFAPSTVTPAGSSALVITNTGSAVPGTYTMTVTAVSTTGTKTQDIDITIGSSNPTAVTLLAPANASTGASTPIALTWSAASEGNATYTIEVATDAGFSSIIETATNLTGTSYTTGTLNPNTTYYWRVMYTTPCGTSAWSSVFNFTTNGCLAYTSTNVPVTIPASGAPTVTSIITVPTSGIVNDVNVLNIIGTHTWIKNLTFSLTSPQGTTVTLFDQICNNQDDFNVGFDDASALATLPCPPTDGLLYQPLMALSAFNGENAQGNWTLTINDVANNNGGQLNGWELELCTDPTTCIDAEVPVLAGTATICEGTSTSLSVTSGNLNDATNWIWYDDACGGNVVGSGTTLSVSPLATTTYFVRGEGGCVTPGTCATVTVSVNPSYNSTVSATICDGQTYTFPDGTTATTAMTQTSVLSSVNGCDSTIVTNLLVAPVYNSTVTASICQGQTYTFPDGSTSMTATTQTSTLSSIDGCDSTIVTTLTVNPTYNQTETASICQGGTYMYPDGTTGTVTETHTSLLTSINGCDSVIVTNLTVNPTYSLSENASICSGDSYTFPDGTTGTTSGSHTSVLTTALGCDSIIVTNLTVAPTYNQSVSATICTGQTYTFPDGSTSTTATIQTSTLTSTNGCDSIIVTDLSVVSGYLTNESATICQGDSYTYPDGTIGTVSEQHTSALFSTGGCDSTIVTDLIVNPTYNLTETATICQGSAYTYPDGSTGVTSEIHTSVLTTINGCDSVIVTDLIVNPTYSTTETASICSGASYTYPDGTTGTMTETHTSVLSTVNGCDSIIVTDLTVNTTSNTTESITICSGETYTFPDGTTGNTSTSYTSVITSSNGCDSIIVTQLTVSQIDNTVTTNAGFFTANQAGAQYQWYDCQLNQELTGETNQTFDPLTLTGEFAVIVTLGNCTDTSVCILHDETGIEETDLFGFQLFPNPIKNNLYVVWGNEVNVTLLTLTDVNGKILLEVDPQSGNETIVNVEAFADGTYFVHLNSDKGKLTKKVIKLN